MDKMYPNTFLSSVFPSTTSVFSMYTGFIATAMVLRTVINEFQSLMIQLIPQIIQDKISSKLQAWFCSPNSSPSVTTLVIDEYTNGFSKNEIYEASQLYLQDKISPFSEKLKVMKSPREKNILVTVNKGEEIVDFFQGIKLTWSMITAPPNSDSSDNGRSKEFEKRSMEITLPKNQRETIITSYLPHVLKCAKSIKERNTGIKLFATGHYGGDSHGIWGSINLDHPSTFDMLAMDPTVKKALIDDLDRFVSRREYYKRVGKAWKRGYLLYGPPGTGKSSLIAAMSNYLKFNVYDLELRDMRSDRNFRHLLVSTANRSIIVIEDIDCGMKNRHDHGNGDNEQGQLKLSGLLNFVDGLWSSCGDEKIIVFTTNRKDKLDPALLRPGRMDMHIHMSYLTPTAFEILARNYLEETNHRLFPRVKELLAQVEVTPAQVAEELMKSDDVDMVVENLIEFLESKEPTVKEGDFKSGNVDLDDDETQGIYDDECRKS